MSRFKSIFVYKPTTADRAVAVVPTQDVIILEYPNHCRHVAGDVVELTFWAAVPNFWWRDIARQAATQIVQATGGIAWDEQGTIKLVVPRCWALAAQQMMGRLAPFTVDDNAKALFAAGLVLVNPSGDQLGLLEVPSWQIEATRWVGAGEASRILNSNGENRFAHKVTLDGDDAVSVTIVAPWLAKSWKLILSQEESVS